MERTTQRELKQGVKWGYYKPYNGETLKRYEKIKYSASIYGINGGLIKDTDTGEVYAITARNSDLFRFF